MFCCVFFFDHTNAPREGIQNSLGFWIPRCGFRILGPGFRILCQWNLDSEFQALVVFRILWTVFWIPKPGIPDAAAKIFWIPDPTSKNVSDSGIRCPLYGANTSWEIQAKRFTGYLIFSSSRNWPGSRNIISQSILAFLSDSLLLLPIYIPYVKHVSHRPARMLQHIRDIYVARSTEFEKLRIYEE